MLAPFRTVKLLTPSCERWPSSLVRHPLQPGGQGLVPFGQLIIFKNTCAYRTAGQQLRGLTALQAAAGTVPAQASSSISSGGGGGGSSGSSREEHNRNQSQIFNGKADEFLKPLPQKIQQRLKTIVDSVPGLGDGSRVIDVGSGTGCLIPHILARGSSIDVLAVDLSPRMLEALMDSVPHWQQQQKQQQRTGCSSSSDLGSNSSGSSSSSGGGSRDETDGGLQSSLLMGNTPAVRTWLGDVQDLPPYQGGADAIFFNAVFGNLHNPRATLLHAALTLLKPGGHVVVSHPEGRGWHGQLHRDQPSMVPHELPDLLAMQQLLRDLPLELVGWRDDPELYLAVLQVPPLYRLHDGPVAMEGTVVHGAKRGSRQMGVPTANLRVADVAPSLLGLHAGVYFGWAQLLAEPGTEEDACPTSDLGVHKMVMNVGVRPTIQDGSALSVEVHVMHNYSSFEFYGRRLRVMATSFLRPEMKFPKLDALVGRIRADVAVAKYALDEEALAPDTIMPGCFEQ